LPFWETEKMSGDFLFVEYGECTKSKSLTS
jgi:hypothetical protein